MGCSKQPSAQRDSTAATANAASSDDSPPPIDLSTPDRALKSYWAVKEWINRYAYAQAVTYIQGPKYKKQLATHLKVLAGDAKQEIEENAARSNERDTYRYEIISVKEETDTRAVVEARIWNTSPIPAGADPSESERKDRRDGNVVRYILERDADGWKVVQAKYLPYAAADWSSWWVPGRISYPSSAYP